MPVFYRKDPCIIPWENIEKHHISQYQKKGEIIQRKKRRRKTSLLLKMIPITAYTYYSSEKNRLSQLTVFCNLGWVVMHEIIQFNLMQYMYFMCDYGVRNSSTTLHFISPQSFPSFILLFLTACLYYCFASVPSTSTSGVMGHQSKNITQNIMGN